MPVIDLGLTPSFNQSHRRSNISIQLQPAYICFWLTHSYIATKKLKYDIRISFFFHHRGSHVHYIICRQPWFTALSASTVKTILAVFAYDRCKRSSSSRIMQIFSIITKWLINILFLRSTSCSSVYLNRTS